MFCFFTKHGSFDFVANILSNLSAIKEGRDYMLRNKMLAKIIEFLKFERVNPHRRAHLIETMRNIAFEYEIEEKFFSQVILLIFFMFIDSSRPRLCSDVSIRVRYNHPQRNS